MISLLACTAPDPDAVVRDTQAEEPPEVHESSVGGWSALVVSDSTACAMLDGVGRCWGSYEGSLDGLDEIHGGIGFACGLADGAALCSEEIEVPPVDRMTDLACGGQDCCGVTVAGSLSCWGTNTFLSEAAVSAASTVAVSFWTACAAPAEGSPTCWGWRGGDGEFMDEAVLPAGAYADIACGAEWRCGVTLGGRLACGSVDGLAFHADGVVDFGLYGLGYPAVCSVDAGGVVDCTELHSQRDYPLDYVAGAEALNALGRRLIEVEVGLWFVCVLDDDGYVSCVGSDRDPPP